MRRLSFGILILVFTFSCKKEERQCSTSEEIMFSKTYSGKLKKCYGTSTETAIETNVTLTKINDSSFNARIKAESGLDTNVVFKFSCVTDKKNDQNSINIVDNVNDHVVGTFTTNPSNQINFGFYYNSVCPSAKFEGVFN